MSGPTSVFSSRPGPSRSRSARSQIILRSRSWTFSCTTSRLVAVHRWPVVPKAPHSTPSSARSKSASSITSIAFLPPISSDSRLCIRPQVAPMIAPVSVEPVKEITVIAGCSTIALPTTEPSPCTSCTASGGSPASRRISTSRWAVCGTSSAGLKITAFPHSSAGNIFQVGIASGKLNGVMSPARPIGRRKLIAHLWRSSDGTVRPNSRRPSVCA